MEVSPATACVPAWRETASSASPLVPVVVPIAVVPASAIVIVVPSALVSVLMRIVLETRFVVGSSLVSREAVDMPSWTAGTAPGRPRSATGIFVV